MTDLAEQRGSGDYPVPTVYEPTQQHTHTIIFLHGRGGSGPEFSSRLFESKLTAASGTLRTQLSSWRWVFPSAKKIWSTNFRELHPTWFDAYSLVDIYSKEELQTSGITEAVAHISDIIKTEVERLDGHSEKVVLAGFSQGSATALWTLLSQDLNKKLNGNPLGAFLGSGCWLPFDKNVNRVLDNEAPRLGSEHPDAGAAFVSSTLSKEFLEMVSLRSTESHPLPVFLGHGADDEWIDVTLGQAVRDSFKKAGCNVLWKEYTGGNDQGHWFKEPEQLLDMHEFLTSYEGTARLAQV
jgi:lysophospholipase II